jgi:hypothetical protein
MTARKLLALAIVLGCIGYLIFCWGSLLWSVPFSLTALVLIIYVLGMADKLH